MESYNYKKKLISQSYNLIKLVIISYSYNKNCNQYINDYFTTETETLLLPPLPLPESSKGLVTIILDKLITR